MSRQSSRRGSRLSRSTVSSQPPRRCGRRFVPGADFCTSHACAAAIARCEACKNFARLVVHWPDAESESEDERVRTPRTSPLRRRSTRQGRRPGEEPRRRPTRHGRSRQRPPRSGAARSRRDRALSSPSPCRSWSHTPAPQDASGPRRSRAVYSVRSERVSRLTVPETVPRPAQTRMAEPSRLCLEDR